MEKMRFQDVMVGTEYMVKSIGGWRKAIVTEKHPPRKGVASDYFIVKWKYAEPNIFGCTGGITPSKDGLFNIKPVIL